jgi:hypothetical protein
MDDLTPLARAAADAYARARTALRAAQTRLAAAEVPLDPVDGLPPAWTPEQHAAIVDMHKALQQLVLARSAWIAAPKT